MSEWVSKRPPHQRFVFTKGIGWLIAVVIAIAVWVPIALYLKTLFTGP
jgi:hypothetical protein